MSQSDEEDCTEIVEQLEDKTAFAQNNNVPGSDCMISPSMVASKTDLLQGSVAGQPSASASSENSLLVANYSVSIATECKPLGLIPLHSDGVPE